MGVFNIPITSYNHKFVSYIRSYIYTSICIIVTYIKVWKQFKTLSCWELDSKWMKGQGHCRYWYGNNHMIH